MQFLCRHPADALAVHGQKCGPRGGHHQRLALRFEFDERRGGDGLDLGHDQRGLLAFDDLAQRDGVGHVDHMGAMGHLMCRRIGIAIHCDHLDPKALQADHHLLAQFSRAEQHHAGSTCRERSSDHGHCTRPIRLTTSARRRAS